MLPFALEHEVTEVLGRSYFEYLGWRPIESSLRPHPVIDPLQADVELDVLFAPYGPQRVYLLFIHPRASNLINLRSVPE